MRVTAQDLKALGVIDTIVSEPLGGAHRDPAAAIGNLKQAIIAALADVGPVRGDALRTAREDKFLRMGRL
jgi:acetyl-CoA carboxylase carboxyl transferase subunit alpha